MKRIVSALLALAVLAALVAVTTTSKHVVPAVYAQSGGCSVANLHGHYAFSQPGWAPLNPGGNQLPFFNVGVAAFDGTGTLTSVSFTDVFNGAASTETDAGTYTVNPDCTGSMSITTGPGAGVTFNIVIIDGAELFGINTSEGFTSSFDAKKMRSE